jgi:lipopolysaccharide/colanic/teichoic acid biosynthesis glycosyltransferase
VARRATKAKRLIDIGLATFSIAILSPALALIGILVRVRLGRPVLYRQTRLGFGETSFELVKFRTMTDDRDTDGHLLPDIRRLTPLGRRLRALSLDELPQLWNVLIGDMSIVGPRPLPVSYRPRFTADERIRHAVRPGITGWAQVHGRNSLEWDERLAMDAWYAQHWTLRLDVLILLRTIRAVLAREGIAADGEATMPVLRPDAHDDVTKDM